MSPLKGDLTMAMESAAPAQELKLETEKKPNGVLIRCSGRIVSSTSPYLRQTARPLIAENKLVVMDLTEVVFLDSSGLGTIVGLWVNAKKNNCEFKLIRLNERIKDLLHMTHLASLEGDQDYFGF
jgi:anti-anti-sigma factor